MTGKCEEERECEPNQELVYDPVLGDYVCKDIDSDSDPHPDPTFDPLTPIEDEEDDETEEDIIKGINIDRDAKGIPKEPGSRYVNTKSGVWSNAKPSDMHQWIKTEKQDFQLKGRDAQNRRYVGVWEFGDLHGLKKWLDAQADTNLISYGHPSEGKGYFMAFSINPDASNAHDHWQLWQDSISSVRGGLSKVQEGDSIRWRKMDKSAKDLPPEWGLDFPEGEVWMLYQDE